MRPSPALATAPQGPGIADAIPLSPDIRLPAPDSSPPPIRPPPTCPVAVPKALRKPLFLNMELEGS